MKPIRGIKNKFLAYGLAAILLGSGPLTASAQNDGVVQTQGNVSYVSGGVGTESLDRLNAIIGDFNLKLVFARVSGEYLSNVRVVIADAKARTILETTSEGPWLLAKLPAGKYRITATVEGKEQKRQITTGAIKLTTVDFRWIAP
jgi:hypothetical protein